MSGLKRACLWIAVLSAFLHCSSGRDCDEYLAECVLCNTDVTCQCKQGFYKDIILPCVETCEGDGYVSVLNETDNTLYCTNPYLYKIARHGISLDKTKYDKDPTVLRDLLSIARCDPTAPKICAALNKSREEFSGFRAQYKQWTEELKNATDELLKNTELTFWILLGFFACSLLFSATILLVLICKRKHSLQVENVVMDEVNDMYGKF